MGLASLGDPSHQRRKHRRSCGVVSVRDAASGRKQEETRAEEWEGGSMGASYCESRGVGDQGGGNKLVPRLHTHIRRCSQRIKCFVFSQIPPWVPPPTPSSLSPHLTKEYQPTAQHGL